MVAAGILSSRLLGFIRERAIAGYFGVGPYADVWRMALKGPNILQNLLGEGTISAAFIPIYSRLLEEGKEEEAGRFAGAVFGLLLALAAAISVLGFLLAEPIVSLLTLGFLGDAEAVSAGSATVDRFPLAVRAVRIIFPMTGILVLSGWALGILNSHRRFFLPYFAPVMWNASILGALTWVGFRSGWHPEDLDATGLETVLFAACVGALVGGGLQFLVQLPLVVRLLRGFRFSLSTRVAGVKRVIRAFGPVVAGRGVYQISAFLDLFLASLLAEGALSSMGFALQLYLLPVGLFGLSVAAAELPELSRKGRGNLAELAGRMAASLRQMAFLIVPTCLGFLLFGFLLVGAIYRVGEFGLGDNWLVYLVLAAYTVGLPATTISRLLQNSFYALGDTKTPARIAVLRLAVSATVGIPLMLWLDNFRVEDWISGVSYGGEPGAKILYMGALGLAAGSAVSAWLELAALRRAQKRMLEGFRLPWGAMGRMALLALAAVIPAAILWRILPPIHVALQALAVVGLYAGTYLALARIAGISELEAWLGRFKRRTAGEKP